ncbi:MAG: NAD-dependent epimerase/dehydratase family protein [Humidesulfovibrio sp.]|nr:NAD-dependent epimerase/dehydratase family protein [Humidesulfovibrio sp.]
MNIKGSKILVTGGAGFIGSHIVDFLLRQGAAVRILDNLSFGTMENLVGVKDDIEFIQGDILDPETVAKSVKGMDIVSHHAAQLEIFVAAEDPSWDLKVNTIGTLNVFEAARQAGVGRVVNASSACVYGQKDGLTTETDSRKPNWAYGVSKLAAEEYGRIYSETKGLDVVSLRYSIVYGEREWFRRVLPIFLKRALDGKPPVVFGDGNQIRDFVHVEDVVRMHDACITDDRAVGEMFNVSTGIGVSVVELAQAVAKLFLDDPQIIHEQVAEGKPSAQIPGKRRNAAELKAMLLAPDKAKILLDWEPKVPLEEGLRREYEWAKAHPHRWGKILNSNWNV